MITDVIVIVVLLISALISFIRGFIRETLTILGVGGGLAAAYVGGPLLSPSIKDWLGVKEGAEPQRLFGVLPYPILADIMSYGLIFIGVVIVLSIVSHILAETVRAVGFGAVDRTLGVVFGLARGLLLLAILYLPIHLSVEPETKTEWFKDSKTQPMLEVMADELKTYLPDSTIKQIQESTKTVTEDNGVKERIKQIDLLKTGEGEQAPASQSPQESTEQPPAEGAPQGAEGYTDDFRKQMDKMFQQPAPSGPPQPQPQPGQSQ